MQIARPDPDVVFTPLANDEAMLLHIGTQTYFSLNETGSFIWKRMEQGTPLDAIADELRAEYDVTAEEARQSVEDLARELSEAALVTLESS